MHYFHTILSYQKPMLRQIEWWVQNGPISKNGVLPVTTLFFWKFCFSFRTSYKVLIWCTNQITVRYFFPVSILKLMHKVRFIIYIKEKINKQISSGFSFFGIDYFIEFEPIIIIINLFQFSLKNDTKWKSFTIN